jgi:hypothetical protein
VKPKLVGAFVDKRQWHHVRPSVRIDGSNVKRLLGGKKSSCDVVRHLPVVAEHLSAKIFGHVSSVPGSKAEMQLPHPISSEWTTS